MLTVLILFSCVGAGAVGGVFFGFSAFIMKALSGLPPASGVAAMQRINIAVINPLFLGVFLGTGAVAALCAVWSIVSWSGARSPLLLAAALLYLAGCLGVTMALNVPLNNQLARLPSGSPEAAGYWPQYLREWVFWNHLRTGASLAAAACWAAALTLA